MIHNFKFHLDKSSRKYRCPACGHRTFVLYLDALDREIAPGVGRCDRLDKCRHHCTPRQYFDSVDGIARSLSWDEYVNLHEAKQRQGLSSIHVPIEPRAKNFTLDSHLVQLTTGNHGVNNLVDWLWTRFAKVMTRQQFDHIIDEYKVGTSRHWDGATVWWQIDTMGRVRTGKVMAYNPHDGHRVKHPHPLMQWAHKLAAGVPDDFELRQCYFGSHLLARYPEATVWLLESEKGALVMALALEALGRYGRIIPVACGGCGGFNTRDHARWDPENKLSVLRYRQVVAIPDDGMWEEWERQASRLGAWCEWIRVSPIVDKEYRCDALWPVDVPIDDGDGPDDIVLRYLAMDSCSISPRSMGKYNLCALLNLISH